MRDRQIYDSFAFRYTFHDAIKLIPNSVIDSTSMTFGRFTTDQFAEAPEPFPSESGRARRSSVGLCACLLVASTGSIGNLAFRLRAADARKIVVADIHLDSLDRLADERTPCVRSPIAGRSSASLLVGRSPSPPLDPRGSRRRSPYTTGPLS